MKEPEQRKKFHFPFQRKFQWRDFLRLPAWARLLMISAATLLVLTAVFFLTGSYLYSPQKTARDYYEAKLDRDWNRMYDCCRFPEGQFLSRKNFVNALSYGTSETDDTPEIMNYRMRRKETDPDTGVATYSVSFTLQGISEAQTDTVKIARGSHIMGPFYEWYIVPDSLYVTDVEIVVPQDAEFYLDGTRILDQYKKDGQSGTSRSTGGEAVYEIPCLFLGYHTVQIHEQGRTDYREIVYVQDDSQMEFLPELKLNDSTGKEIADLVEKAVQNFCDAGMKKKPYSRISQYFSEDASVQKEAEKMYEEFCQGVADEDHTGLVKLAVTNVETTVSNTDGEMKVETAVSYTAERVEKRLFFFYKTVTESGTRQLDLQVVSSDGEWKIEKF